MNARCLRKIGKPHRVHTDIPHSMNLSVLRRVVAHAVEHGDLFVLANTHSMVTAFLRANIHTHDNHPTIEKLIRLVCIMSAIMRRMVGSLAAACTHDANQMRALVESTRRMCVTSVEMRRMFAKVVVIV
jgi:hypothetical protein